MSHGHDHDCAMHGRFPPCAMHGRFRHGDAVEYDNDAGDWRQGTVVGSHLLNNQHRMIWIEFWDKSRVQVLEENVLRLGEPRPCSPPKPPCPPQPECPNFVKDVLAHVVAARRIIDSSYGWPLGVREAFQLLGQAQEYLASACPQPPPPPPCPPAQPMRYWILREGSPLTGQMFATIEEARQFRDGLEPATRRHALIIDLLMLIVE